MADILFGFFGMFIRWIFIYKCDSKKMAEAYNSDPGEEGTKNNLAGLVLMPIGMIIGIIIYILEK